jgi:hypothetical protein
LRAKSSEREAIGRGIRATVQHRPIDIQSKVAKKNQITRKNNIKGIGGPKKKDNK